MCTNFKHRPAEDGTVVVGRTMEFPEGLPWQMTVLAKDTEVQAILPGGLRWTGKHGVVGVGVGRSLIADGMNEVGLSGHALYMAGFCHFAEPRNDGTDLSEGDVLAYLLSTCTSIEEVKQAATDLNVCGYDPGFGFVPPLHFLFHDRNASVAIEMRPEGLSVIDNPLGVATNSPFLDWHLINVRNYTGISPHNPVQEFDGYRLEPLGQGGGLRGLPGDYTPPARFVRALAQVTLAEVPADGAAAERSTLHILNSFDINRGLIIEQGHDGKPVPEVTEWSTLSNLTQGRYAIRTIDDPNVYVIDVTTTDFSSDRFHALPGGGGFIPLQF